MTIVQRIITLFTCMAFLVSGFAQKKVQQIEIVHADYTMMDKSINPDAQMLIGDVVFKHENAIMKCDSAYYYPNSNYVEAFDNIHINQGDTLHLYGDFLIYSGIEKLAKVRRNVKLVDKQSTLTTQYLDFNLGEDFAYYINGGHIINGENNLDSETGYYYSKRKVFYFKDSVVIVNPDYNMYSDTLRYNTVSKVAFFLGPTEIISKNNYIYCENGWYNTETNISQFEENAFIRGEHRTISGDSLYYERDNGFGEAFMNVVINDTLDKIILNGNYARYYENPERALLTDSTLFIKVTETDSMHVHADTLISTPDTIPDAKIIRAYFKVKMYKTDVQSKCDSLVYTSADSIIRLYRNPVLWSEEHQLTADFIEIYTTKKNIDKIEMYNNAYIVSREDTAKYNQVKGRNMTGYFRAGELKIINVNGNGQTIYYPKDNEEIIGVNKAESAKMIIYLKDKSIERINFLTNPVANLSPLNQVNIKEMKFPGFQWLQSYRPKSKHDVFIWKE